MNIDYVSYDELFKKRMCIAFDLECLPVFPKSYENVVVEIVRTIRDIIRTYGYITIEDVYDTIEMYEPSLSAAKKYTNTKYGWKCINDLYVLYVKHGVTIGIQTKPILLD